MSELTINDVGPAQPHLELGRVDSKHAIEQAELVRLREQAARDRAQIEHLELALQSARTIGIALGIIVAGSKMTPDQAFAHLSKLSNRLNTKVRDLAEAIVTTGVY